MELQISHRVCTEIPAESVFWIEKGSNQRNTEAVVPVEGGRNHRRGSVPGSCAYAGEYPAEIERIGVHGIFEREK